MRRRGGRPRRSAKARTDELRAPPATRTATTFETVYTTTSTETLCTSPKSWNLEHARSDSLLRLIPPFLPRLSPAGTAAAGGTTVVVHTTTSTRIQTVNAATQRNRRRVTSAASPGLHFAHLLTHSHPYNSHLFPSGNRTLVVPLLSPIIISTPPSSARGQIYPCVSFKPLGSLKPTHVSVSTLLEFIVVRRLPRLGCLRGVDSRAPNHRNCGRASGPS